MVCAHMDTWTHGHTDHGHGCTDTQTHRHGDTQTHGHMDHRHMDKETMYIWTHRHTDTWTLRFTGTWTCGHTDTWVQGQKCGLSLPSTTRQELLNLLLSWVKTPGICDEEVLEGLRTAASSSCGHPGCRAGGGICLSGFDLLLLNAGAPPFQGCWET